jgi:transcription termination factor NusG
MGEARMSIFWGVARTLPRKELFAAERLKESGFETLLPRLRNGRSGPVPMFVGYLFVEIIEQWRIVDCTLGVMKFIRFGDAPARMPDKEIAALKARMDSDGLIVLPPPPGTRRRAFAKGDPVKIVGGAFDGLAGMHSGMSAAQVLNAQRQVAIPAQLLRPA